MKLRLFYRTQRDVAKALNELIDSYWNRDIDEDYLLQGVYDLYEHNGDKMIKNRQFTTVLIQQSGKRRLAIVKRILTDHID